MNTFDFVHKYRKALLFLLTFIAVAGVVLVFRMPVSLFPQIVFPRIVILADNGEQPIERMMVEVTKPIEEAVNSVPGVTLVRSITSRGSAEISISLSWGENVRQALQSIQGRIANIRNTLPPAASVQAEQMDVSIFPIQSYCLTSDSVSLADLRDYALYQLRPILMRVNGIAQVQVTGGDTREFQVIVSPEKLQSFGLAVTEITDAIAKRNLLEATGLISNNHFLYLSLASGAISSIAEIDTAVVAVRNGVVIRVGDVARVVPAVAESHIRTTAYGKPAVLLNIIKQPSGSTVDIGNNVTAVLAGIHLGRNIAISNTYDQSFFIGRSIANTRDSIIIGIVLAMIVLLLFLGSWRITSVIALIVPTTISATIVCLYGAGKSINIMTLGGIAASIGLVIDDAIVVIENIFTRFPESKKIYGAGPEAFAHAAGLSLKEMMPAIVGSTLSTIVIQVPLLFLGGITGAFFRPLSLTMIFALVISFLFSITIAPLIASRMVHEKDIERESQKEERTTKLSLFYAKTLRVLMRYRFVCIPGAVVLIAATAFLCQKIGTEFMPEMDEGAFVLDYWAPPGTSLAETDRMLASVEKILMAIPEVEAYSRRTGTQLGFFITEPNTGDFLIKLKRDRTRNVEEIIDEVRKKVEAAQPALSIDFGQLIMDVIGDLVNGPSPIEIKLFGDNAAVLEEKAREVTRYIERIPGVVDAFDGIVVSGPSFIMHVDARRAALAGLTTADVAEQMATYMEGAVANKVQYGEKLMDIRVQMPANYHTDFDRIQNAMLVNKAGESVALSRIAGFEKTAGSAECDREGLRRMVAVTARISGRDMGHTMLDIKRTLGENLVLPKGVTLSFGGLYQTQQESFRDLLIAALAAIALVFVVMLVEFREFTVPFSVFTITILSLFGSFLALYITGISLNISSFVGIILIIGIVAENAIFVMHATNVYRERHGCGLEDALVKACLERTRPILMTTLGAVLAFLPLSLGIGAGAQMQQPLAIAVIGGFSISSLLLFFGLPVVYRILKS